MTFANFPELGRALTQQCSRAVLPEQEFAFLQRIVLVETRTLDLLDLVVPSTNSATQPQLLPTDNTMYHNFVIDISIDEDS